MLEVKCLPAGEGLSKKQYANTLHYYSELKINELSRYENT